MGLFERKRLRDRERLEFSMFASRAGDPVVVYLGGELSRKPSDAVYAVGAGGQVRKLADDFGKWKRSLGVPPVRLAPLLAGVLQVAGDVAAVAVPGAGMALRAMARKAAEELQRVGDGDLGRRLNSRAEQARFGEGDDFPLTDEQWWAELLVEHPVEWRDELVRTVVVEASEAGLLPDALVDLAELAGLRVATRLGSSRERTVSGVRR